MSRIRVERITDKQGTGAPLFPNGISVVGLTSLSNVVSGIVTASQLFGDGSNLTSVTATDVGTLSSLNVTGNVSIGGTLTYEDVTNVDSIGIVTARDGIDSPTNLVLRTGGTERLRIDSIGNASLGNVTAAPTSSAYNAGTLHIHQATGGASGGSQIKMTTTQSGSAAGDGAYFAYYGNNELYIYNKENADISFGTNATERLRIGSAGQLGLSGANYGTSGQVLTSQGGSAAVQWADAGGGAVEVIQNIDLATTNTANIISSSWTSANYSKIVVTLQDIGCGSNQAANISMRIYLDGSEVTSGNRYEYSGYGNNDFGGGSWATLVAESGDNHVMLTDSKWSYSLSGEIEFWNPGFAAGSFYGNHRTFTGKTHCAGGSDFAKMGYLHGYMKTSNNSVINGVKFYEVSSGKTFTSGKVTVYGYKRS